MVLVVSVSISASIWSRIALWGIFKLNFCRRSARLSAITAGVTEDASLLPSTIAILTVMINGSSTTNPIIVVVASAARRILFLNLRNTKRCSGAKTTHSTAAKNNGSTKDAITW